MMQPLRALLAALCLCVASGHGYLLTPVPRQNGGDMSGHQDDPAAGGCKSLPPGPAAATLTAGQAADNLTWTIVIVHSPGFCSLRWARNDSGIAYDGSAGLLLWSSTTCGDALGDAFRATFAAPPASAAGTGVLQWYWDGGGQIYQDCVDVEVVLPPSASAGPPPTTPDGAADAQGAAALLTAGAVAGIAIGAVVAAALLVAGLVVMRRSGTTTRKRALAGAFGAGHTVVSAQLPLACD